MNFDQTAPPDFLTTSETLAFLSISRPTLRRWVIAGRLKQYRVGERARYHRCDVEALIKPTSGAIAAGL